MQLKVISRNQIYFDDKKNLSVIFSIVTALYAYEYKPFVLLMHM